MSNGTCTVEAAPIPYTDTGTGTPTVFVHGVYVTGALWDNVVAILGDRVRSIVPTWPLGAHDALPASVDVSVRATARRTVGLIEQLDLHDVTVVANDTGGGLVLSALGDPTLDLSRIGRLVLTNCDSYQHFPPARFAPLVWLCRFSPAAGRAALRALASEIGQWFFLRQVTRRPMSASRRHALFGPFVTSPATRRQAVAVTASLDAQLTLRAAEPIRRFAKPVTVVWGRNDAMFPLTHARRLVGAFPRAHLIEISDCSTYVMLDAPTELATAILSEGA